MPDTSGLDVASEARCQVLPELTETLKQQRTNSLQVVIPLQQLLLKGLGLPAWSIHLLRDIIQLGFDGSNRIEDVLRNRSETVLQRHDSATCPKQTSTPSGHGGRHLERISYSGLLAFAHGQNFVFASTSWPVVTFRYAWISKRVPSAATRVPLEIFAQSEALPPY